MATSHDQEAYEEHNVHEVYQQIAGHFSLTRHKPWPVVERFLQNLSPGSIGLDVGCGNGKYLPVNKNVFIIASDRYIKKKKLPTTLSCSLAPFLILIIDQIPDRSENLVRIAVTHQPHSTIIADNLNLPHPDAFFDFAISIAVIHHLSTQERRTQAIQEILRTLRPATESYPGGRALIYAWALEQKNSRRGWDKGDSQDVMVPWILKGGSAKDGSDEPPKTFHRYYHLYEESELERDIKRAGGRVLESGYDRDNWWAIATRSNE